MDISKTVGKSKSVIHCILRKLKETGSCETKKPLARPKKTTAREDRLIGNKSKKDWLVTATTISKRANANFGIKISRHTISQRLTEINLNSWVASTKPYISKKNKMSQLKFVTEYVIWTEEQLDCQNLTCSVVTRDGSFDAVQRNDIHLSALKAALNLEKEVWWFLAWFLLLVQDL